MALQWRYMVPGGSGNGTLASPWGWNSLEMQAGLTPGMIVGLLPGQYTDLEALEPPADMGTTSATPLVFCGVDTHGSPLDPTRSVFETGPLVASTLREVGLDDEEPLVLNPPNYLWLFALRIVGNRQGYIVDPGSEPLTYAHSFMIDSCDVENQSENENAGGIHLGLHSALSNSDVLIQAGAEACVKDETSSLIAICRLHGGQIGIQNQAKNTAILNTVLREHTLAGILYNGAGLDVSARIHIASVTGHKLGDFLRILGDLPAEGIGYILDGHITECSGALVRCMGTDPSAKPSTVIVRNTRRRAVEGGDAVNVVGTELWTLHTHDDSTGDAQDYEKAAEGDFRLVPTAIGRNKSLLSDNDLGAFLNMAYF